MAEHLGLGPGVRQLKLGPTFTSNKPSSAFHTLKYDFKPASVDVSKIARVDVGSNNTMTVTVPHLDGAGVPHTVFKGSQRPYHKECVLIIDKLTGEVVIERLSSNIQVKKTRAETKSQQQLGVPSVNSGNRSVTPELRTSPTNGRTKSRTKVTSGKKKEPSFQLPSKPSPPHIKQNQTKNSQSTSSSMETYTSGGLPMLSLDNDDFLSSPPQPAVSHKISPPRIISPEPQKSVVKNTQIVKEQALSETSSSSSDSSDSSDSESENEKKPQSSMNDLFSINSKEAALSMPEDFLNEDLQLSESESDSD